MKTGSLALAASFLLAQPAFAQEVQRGDRAILEITPQLKNGEYVWAPELARDGQMLVIVNLATQRLIAFRNGVPIGASTVSSGKDGYETPTGVFTILQKAKEHYSKTYNNAPMPNMQRLTWKGIALHAGNLPGYPASHGCIRLPPSFSSLLFGATSLGMTVVITSFAVSPQRSGAPALATEAGVAAPVSLANAAYEWHPDHGHRGIVSVVVSTADQRAIVLRDGVEIGTAPVRYSGNLTMPVAYVLRGRDGGANQWLKLYYGGSGGSMEVAAEEGRNFDAPTNFRHQLATILSPGSIVIVTPQPLKSGGPGTSLTVIENEEASR
ncbi:MAG TPA: L,D-transpeptidase family protein [Sphingomicrobium sp.]